LIEKLYKLILSIGALMTLSKMQADRERVGWSKNYENKDVFISSWFGVYWISLFNLVIKNFKYIKNFIK
jgi:hypothetical protein